MSCGAMMIKSATLKKQLEGTSYLRRQDGDKNTLMRSPQYLVFNNINNYERRLAKRVNSTF